MTFKKLFVFLTVLVMPFSLALGQAVSTNGGAIEGTITDPTGASIPGATIVISEPATGYTHTVKTDSAGYYTVGPILPGTYTVAVSAPAFKGLTDTKVVHTGTVTSGDEKLTIGSAGESVTVTAGALQVNTDQIGVAGIVTQEQIDTLPVNGRNILDVAQIQPGVILQSGITFDPTKAGYSALSVSGVGGRTTRILLDGQDVTDETVGTTIFNIPSGAVGEVQLNRSTQDISGSVTSTGQLLMSTRSGTNGFHGNAFYNFQDNNAGFANVNGLPAPFQRNQYGGYVGGYIIKDKLFFFGGGERIQQTEQDVASGENPVFASIVNEFPFVPAPFHDTFSMGRLDYNAPHNIHMFVRGAYSVNADDATFGYGPYQVYQNRDNVPAIVGGVDMATGHFNNSFRFGYEKFHNLLVDGTAALGSSIYNPSTGPDNQITLAGDLNAGPNFLAPQGTFQSDKQFRYDGSYTISNHNIKYGFEMNRILGGGFADFYGPSLYTTLTVAGNLDPHCDDDPTQGPCPNQPTEGYISPQYLIGNGNGYFSERPGFNLPGGGQFSWRFAAYVGDTWKATQYLTVTAGVRWSVDTDRANQDLATPLCSSVDPSMQFAGCTGDTPLFDQYQAGLGVRTHQPYGDFGPQLGFVFSPGTHKTSIRGGIGIYYESNVFNNSGNARTPSIQADGPYFALGAANEGASTIVVPGVPVITAAPDGTPVSTILNESIANAAPELNDIKAAYQAVVKNALTPNSSYIGTGGGLFANNIYGGPYLSPYSIQFNGGVQHEIKPGLLLSADYVHNATIKIPISVDVNHDGAARTLNTAAAANAIAATLAFCGAPNINATLIPGGCPAGSGVGPDGVPNGTAAIVDFAGKGLDSGTNFLGGTAASYGGLTPATGAAFPGTNPNVGEGLFILPQGRSGYDALQVVLQEQKAHPMPGITDSNLQISYTLSRIVTSTSGTNNADQFFGGARPYDNDNPNLYMGRSNIDHTNELSFGGSVGIKYGLQIGLIGHFFSAPPSTLTLDNNAGNTGQIFITDVNGDGVGGDLVPGTNPGAYMHAVKGKGLNALINQYNSTQAGTLTPAGQALVSAGLMTPNQLSALGGVQQTIAPQPENNPINNPAFRSFDLNATYPIKLKFLGGLSINPGVAMYNVFNMSNFGTQLGTLVNTTDAAPLPPDPNAPTGYVNTINSEAALNRLRINRNSGTFDQGGPRSTEFQLMIKF